VAIGAAVVAFALIFFLAPVVPSQFYRSSDLAFLGPVPAYQSFSCAAFRVGSGYLPANYTSFPVSPQWAYTLSCPPRNNFTVANVG
jgi:hypothetical protein